MISKYRKAWRIVFVIGLIAGVSVVVQHRLADGSLRLVGYTQVVASPARPWWVEVYDYTQGLYWANRITGKIAPRQLSDEERVSRLAHWVFDHFVVYKAQAPGQEDHFFNTVRRGYGYCDQLAHVLATLYWSAGYPARLRMSRNAEGISHHTIAEVRVKDRWVAVDPYFKILFQDSQGRLLSIEELAEFPELLHVYRSNGVEVELADFQRGIIFTTVPYTSFDQLFTKVLMRLWPPRRAALVGNEPPQGGPPEPQGGGGQPVTARAALSDEIRRLDRARWHELMGEDAPARALYTQLVLDQTVSRPVQCSANYWLGRSVWRAGDTSRCRDILTPLMAALSTCPESYQLAATRLWSHCEATPLDGRLVVAWPVGTDVR